MTDWYWAPGDTTPIRETLRDGDGNPIDLQGATSLKLNVTPIHGGTPIITNGTVSNLQVGDGSDGSKGVVQYTPSSGQTSNPSGNYLARITAVLLSGETISFPNNGYLLITIGQPTTPGAARYVSLEELKKTLELSGSSYADQDILDALTAASRGLEDAYTTRWVTPPTTDTRYYTRSGPRTVHLGDAITITQVALDYSYTDVYNDGRVWDWDTGLGTYSTILDPSWYRLLPIEAGTAGNGEPYQTLELSRSSQRLVLPSGTAAIRVTGTFGWLAVPAGVKQAVTMITARLLRRTREAPFGIVAVGADGAAMRARDIASDPDIRFVMSGITGTSTLFV